ncbi:hypothetical protein ACA910_010959 [Epithemia clementina (nom. ined.)]
MTAWILLVLEGCCFQVTHCLEQQQQQVQQQQQQQQQRPQGGTESVGNDSRHAYHNNNGNVNNENGKSSRGASSAAQPAQSVPTRPTPLRTHAILPQAPPAVLEPLSSVVETSDETTTTTTTIIGHADHGHRYNFPPVVQALSPSSPSTATTATTTTSSNALPVTTFPTRRQPQQNLAPSPKLWDSHHSGLQQPPKLASEQQQQQQQPQQPVQLVHPDGPGVVATENLAWNGAENGRGENTLEVLAEQESTNHNVVVVPSRGGGREPLLQQNQQQQQQQQQQQPPPPPRNEIEADEDKAQQMAAAERERQQLQQQEHERQQQQQRYAVFWTWCRQVLGIETLLEIRTFEYLDYMKALPDEDWHDDVEAVVANVEQFPKVPVRGLAAKRNITQGEVVIRIPLQGLLSVATTIDQDPILSTVMGPEIRQEHGWILPMEQQEEGDFGATSDATGEDGEDDNNNNNNNNNNSNNNGASAAAADRASLFWVELPLLALALLHHVRLGAASPLRPYLEILQEQPIDRFPFLWSEEQLRSQVSEGIRTVARGIQRELIDMYETIALPLIASNPHVFGTEDENDNNDDNRNSRNNGTNTGNYNDEDGPFSFQKFQWAFAMVNTRHWQLPIEDLEYSMENSPMYGDQLPPASTPIDEWTAQRQDEQLELDEGTPTTTSKENNYYINNNNNNNGRETGGGNNGGNGAARRSATGGNAAPDAAKAAAPFRHSFLAPVADLLNFGPPCTKGHYNRALHSFEIVASCDFVQGQEVTFWYSDECDHVMVAMYGFMHPMIPPCPSAEEYRVSAQKWQERSVHLQHKLDRAYDQLDALEATVQQLRSILRDCGEECCGRYMEDDDELLLLPDEELDHDTDNNEDENDDTPTHNVRGGGGGGGGSASSSSSGGGGGSHNFRAHPRQAAQQQPQGYQRRQRQEQQQQQHQQGGVNPSVHRPVQHGGGTRRRNRPTQQQQREREYQNRQKKKRRTSLFGEPEEHDDL